MIEVLLSVLNPLTILIMSAGVAYGIVFGAIPGLSSSVAVALVIPLTYGMNSLTALSLLVSVYVGGVSGGLISAILLRIPGTPSSIVTTFDGYPLAQKGQAGNAIGLAIFSSVVGGLIGAVALLTLSPLLAKVTIMFSPFDYFGITVFSLSLVCMLLGANALKGLITTLIGLTLSFVGTSPIDARPRFTFGNHNLDNGFNIIVLIIGIFAVSEMLSSVMHGRKQNEKTIFTKKQGFMPSWAKIKFHAVNMFRSGIIGTALGILPGLIIGLLMMVMVVFISRRRNYPRFERSPLKEMILSFLKAFPALLMPVILVGGFMSGFVTPTEAACLAVDYAIFLGFVFYRNISFKRFWRVLEKTAMLAAVTMIIIACSAVFGLVITQQQLPQKLSAGLLSLTSNYYVIIFMVILILLIMGTLLETTAIMIIITPILMVIVGQVGMDLIQFGILEALVITLGLFTPPVGVGMFLTCKVCHIRTGSFLREIWPFLLMLFLTVLMIAYVPSISLWLPNLLLK
jgi:TRAP-type mannitol/chloroaromatic compound transport system permease large subunit